MSILIVGGGMTGATLALAISRLTHGALPVHLVEAAQRIRRSIRGLMPARLRWRRGPAAAGAYPASGKALPIARRPIQRVHVSDRGHAGFVTLDAQITAWRRLARW